MGKVLGKGAFLPRQQASTKSRGMKSNHTALALIVLELAGCAQTLELVDRPADETLREFSTTRGAGPETSESLYTFSYRDAAPFKLIGLDDWVSAQVSADLGLRPAPGAVHERLLLNYNIAILSNSPVYLGAGVSGSLREFGLPAIVGIVGLRVPIWLFEGVAGIVETRINRFGTPFVLVGLGRRL